MKHDNLRQPVTESDDPGEVVRLLKAVLENIAINSPPPKPPPPTRPAWLMPEGQSILNPTWREPDGGYGYTGEQT